MDTASLRWPSASDASWACVTLAWAQGWGSGRAGWGWGALAMREGGRVERDECSQDATACFVLSSTHVQLKEKRGIRGRCIFLGFRGSPRTIARKSGLFSLFLWLLCHWKSCDDLIHSAISAEVYPSADEMCFLFLSFLHNMDFERFRLHLYSRTPLFGAAARWRITPLTEWWSLQMSAGRLPGRNPVSFFSPIIIFHSPFCSNFLSSPSGGLFWPFSGLFPINTAWCASRHREKRLRQQMALFSGDEYSFVLNNYFNSAVTYW